MRCTNKALGLSTLVASIALLVAPLGFAESLRDAAKAVNAEFKTKQVTALVPLHFKAKYQLYWNGETWGEDRKQGRRTGLAPRGSMAFSEGDTAKQLWVNVKSGKKVLVRMFCCGNKKRGLFSTTQHVDFILRSDDPISPEALTPQALASAMSGFFEFEGYSLSAASEVLNQIGANQPTVAAEADSISNVEVAASPSTIRLGETVALRMSYVLKGDGFVTETRMLSRDGVSIPGYPIVQSAQRPAGKTASELPQGIPKVASPGEYEFKGEVCVGDDCVSKKSRFTVTR